MQPSRVSKRRECWNLAVLVFIYREMASRHPGWCREEKENMPTVSRTSAQRGFDRCKGHQRWCARCCLLLCRSNLAQQFSNRSNVIRRALPADVYKSIIRRLRPRAERGVAREKIFFFLWIITINLLKSRGRRERGSQQSAPAHWNAEKLACDSLKCQRLANWRGNSFGVAWSRRIDCSALLVYCWQKNFSCHSTRTETTESGH